MVPYPFCRSVAFRPFQAMDLLFAGRSPGETLGSLSDLHDRKRPFDCLGLFDLSHFQFGRRLLFGSMEGCFPLSTQGLGSLGPLGIGPRPGFLQHQVLLSFRIFPRTEHGHGRCHRLADLFLDIRGSLSLAYPFFPGPTFFEDPLPILFIGDGQWVGIPGNLPLLGPLFLFVLDLHSSMVFPWICFLFFVPVRFA